MLTLLANARLIDAILVGVALEALVLTILFFVTGRGIAPAYFLANLIAGAGLLAAVRAAMAEAWLWMALFLLLALVAHVADLARRWSADRSTPSARSDHSPLVHSSS